MVLPGETTSLPPDGPGRANGGALWLPELKNAWICASVVLAVGLAAYTLRGARDRLADNT